MNFVPVIQYKVACNLAVSPISFLVYFSIIFPKYKRSHSVNMVDGNVEVISKPEFLEVGHTDFYIHISLINNIVSEDKLEILGEFGNFSSTKANACEIERFIDEKFGEIITANNEKKNTSLSRNVTSKVCLVNFDKMNIETCCRSGCHALQNKKMVKGLNF